MKKNFIKYFIVFFLILNYSNSFMDLDFFDNSFSRIDNQLKEMQSFQKNMLNGIEQNFKNGSISSIGSFPTHFEYIENIKGISIFCYFPEFINEKDLITYLQNDSLIIETNKDGFIFKAILKKDKYFLKSSLNQQTKDESRGKHASSSVGQNIQQINSFPKIVDLEKIELSFHRSENSLIIDIPYSEINKSINNSIPIKIIDDK